MQMSTNKIKVSLVTLGCSRNEVDSEELAGRLEADGWELVKDPAEAQVAVINTCGFISLTAFNLISYFLPSMASQSISLY